MNNEEIVPPSPGDSKDSIKAYLFENFTTLRQIKSLSQNGDFDPEVGDAFWRLADTIQLNLEAIYEV